jgi:diguanylate cyclase (GGDEF)-like protein
VNAIWEEPPRVDAVYSAIQHVGDRGLELLPSHLSRAILTAPVPADLRALFARIPPECRVDARMPQSTSDVPQSARQLVKLASLGGALALGDIGPARPESPLSVTLRRGERALQLGPRDFSADLRAVCSRILDTLFEAEVLARALEAFAGESTTLATLGTLTSLMLRAPDLDHALYAMLSGVTSGFGLGFHRAAVFVLDATTGGFKGSKAIGPSNEDEAHRIWEEMEVEDKELSQIVEDYTLGRVDNRFETFARELVLLPGPSGRDEVQASLSSKAPVWFAGDDVQNEALRALRPAKAYVLAAIAPRAGESVQALLFADDAWSERPVTSERVARLEEFLSQLALVWENLALLVRVEKLARVDSLTGSHNRRVFEERLRDEQSRARRTGAALSVLVLDVDGFKSINDSRGHAAGDEALCRIASVFTRAIREHDTVARIGGDEFAVLLPGIAREEALKVARRIGSLAKEAGVSISIGGASVPDDATDPALVLPLADQNLYAAKRAGKGRARLGEGREVLF